MTPINATVSSLKLAHLLLLPCNVSFSQVLQQHNALGFNQTRWLLYYHNDMEIVLANTSSRDRLAKWTMDKELVVKPNVTLAPTKRFFRVGTAEVTYVISHTPTCKHNKQPCIYEL
jgi:hypothetical protein